jgi:hypothetical protein
VVSLGPMRCQNSETGHTRPYSAGHTSDRSADKDPCSWIEGCGITPGTGFDDTFENRRSAPSRSEAAALPHLTRSDQREHAFAWREAAGPVALAPHLTRRSRRKSFGPPDADRNIDILERVADCGRPRILKGAFIQIRPLSRCFPRPGADRG